MTVTLLHISDVHFGTVIEQTRQGVLDVVAAANPDVIVVTGDVTQRGRVSEFRAFAGLLQQLAPRPVLVVPGNHDVSWWPPWRRLLTPLQGFEHWVPVAHRPPFFVIDDVLLVALPSVNPRRQVAGTMSLGALQNVAKIVQTTPAAVRVAFTHHPLALDRPPRRTHVVTNAPVAAVELGNAGVDLLLSGHLHVPFATSTALAFPGLARPFVLVGAGTATSSRTRGVQARALQLVHVGARRIDIERFEMAPAAKAFAVVDSSHFAQDEGGWRALPTW